eukprot:13282910-Ditylum_brightwellii.AAC.1
MRRVMKHCTLTPRRGLFLRPKGKWDDNANFLFEISGSSDSEYAKRPSCLRPCSAWSIGGRTHHIEVEQYFLQELKEGGILVCKWKSGNEIESYIFTKNCARPVFKKHAA